MNEREIEIIAQANKHVRDLAERLMNDVTLRKWCVEHATPFMSPQDVYTFVLAPAAELLAGGSTESKIR